jgi:uncharacterized repeat protein (TIGR03803 family)
MQSVRQAKINNFMKNQMRNVHVALATILLGLMAVSQARAQTFTNLHNFAYFDGAYPLAGLVTSNGVLYGTTSTGGNGITGEDGTVFKLIVNGSGFTNLYCFSESTDGGDLSGPLILSGNTLYGSAYFGTVSNTGSIFAINTDGSKRTNIFIFPTNNYNVAFGTNADGAFPEGNLCLSGNTLFGIANGGGSESWGTVFAVTTNGSAFTNLQDFTFTNGQYPSAGVIVSNNVIYGVTSDGGPVGFGNAGTIFRMNTDGSAFTNIYYFEAPTSTNGLTPLCPLLLSGNTLFGTAAEGGNYGSGTIYKLNTDGSAFTVLHQFTATNGVAGTNSDGSDPQAGLLLWSNTLYGAASKGGSSGSGAIFQLNLDGTGFKTLYCFSSTNNLSSTNADGATPLGTLVISSNFLYGAANRGGTNADGTIFAIALPVQLDISISGTNAILSWPSTYSGYNLQYATNLAPPITWTTIPQSSGATIVSNGITRTQEFYRLMHP